jgi:hypothetical protein
MKGAVGLGLLVGIVGSIFLPHVFALIGGDLFKTFSNVMASLSTPSGFAGLFSAGFPGPIPLAFIVDSALVFNPDILGLFIVGSGGNTFLAFLPAMLSWLVCGLLSGLFSQSIKKGILSAVVFIIVEILLFMLMRVLASEDLIVDVIMGGGGSPLNFIGGVIITPVGFAILGGLIGGVISRFAFGPEEI